MKLTNEQYHAEKEHISSSIIKLMHTPILAYQAMHQPNEFKTCFNFGTYFHTFILEPELLDNEYFTAPRAHKRTTNYPEWIDFFDSKGADGKSIVELYADEWIPEFKRQTGKSIMSVEEINNAKGMAEALAKNLDAVKLLANGEPERSIFWTDKETGLKLKCRPDYLNNTISDLKTTDARDFKFKNSVLKFGYHISQAMYQDGVYQETGEYLPFKFIVVENKQPFLNAVYWFSDESTHLFHERYREYLNKFVECKDFNSWAGLENKELEVNRI